MSKDGILKSVDLVVVGAGVAGLVAATHAARAGLSVVVVEEQGAGGQVINVDRIANFPCQPPTSGYELGPLLQEEAESAGAEFALARVEGIEVSGADRLVLTGDGIWRSRAVIVAAGSSRRHLGVPGEERLRGRGVSHCASCDGPLYRGLRVCVVGSGDSAVDEAVSLAKHATQVTVLCREAGLHAQAHLVAELDAAGNVEVLTGKVVEEIVGDDTVAAVVVRDHRSGEAQRLATDGVFVYIGLEPNTAFVDGLLALDAERRIVTDAVLQSSVPGIFAAGDIRGHAVAMLAASAGDGATAAAAARRYLASASD